MNILKKANFVRDIDESIKYRKQVSSAFTRTEQKMTPLESKHLIHVKNIIILRSLTTIQIN